MPNAQWIERFREIKDRDRGPFPKLVSDSHDDEGTWEAIGDLKFLLVDADRIVSSLVNRALDDREVNLSWLQGVPLMRPAYLALLPKLAGDEVFVTNVPALIDRLEGTCEVLREFVRSLNDLPNSSQDE